ASVDLTVKVKEKGKNSIGVTGGVSGLEGSFIGLNYQTNNFLGLGETLTVEASVGSLSRVLLFGFTEPYMFDRPLALGFQVYSRKYDFNQAKQAAIQTGQQINLPVAVQNQLLNYNQTSTGFSAQASYVLGRTFKRVGMAYAVDGTIVGTFSEASKSMVDTLMLHNVTTPNSMDGSIPRPITPTFKFHT